jgi:serine phosphatase RsbU (regulator of sigma subunit)
LPDSIVPLHRLVSKKAVEVLINSFGSLLTNQPVVVLDPSGSCFVHYGPAWQDKPEDLRKYRDYVLEGKLGFQAELDRSIYPLLVDQILFGIVIGNDQSPVFTAIKTSLELLISSGLEKRRLARETLDRYREVNLLYHVAEIISGTLDIEEILRIILGEAMRAIPAQSAVAMMSQAFPSTGKKVISLGEEAVAQLVIPDLEKLTEQKEMTHVPTIWANPAGWQGSLLYMPMIARDSQLGLIALVRVNGEGQFQSGEEKLLLALTSQAGFAIDKALLHYSELQRQKVEQELRIGERIQRSLLPREVPAIQGWEFAVSYQSANQVGGDFFDMYELHPSSTGESSWAMLIADVTGKGIPAALMMAFSHAIFQAATSMYHRVGEILAHANQLIIQHSRSGLLLTVFYAILKPGSNQVCFANAGHEPPFWFQAESNTCVELDCGSSLLVGAMGSAKYPENCVTLNPGDILILYTDGVTEARNPKGDFFSTEGLHDIIVTGGKSSAQELLQTIKNAIIDFASGEQQADDITLLIIRRSL